MWLSNGNLAKLVDQVYSVERILPLQKKARKHLFDLQLRNVQLKHSDGGWGWDDYAPYDAILSDRGPPEIPKKLLEQMAVGGIMIIPIGRKTGQVLQKVIRSETVMILKRLEPVSLFLFYQVSIEDV